MCLNAAWANTSGQNTASASQRKIRVTVGLILLEGLEHCFFSDYFGVAGSWALEDRVFKMRWSRPWESKHLSQSDCILYHWYKIFEHCILFAAMKFRQHFHALLCKSQWEVAEAKTKQIYTGFNGNLFNLLWDPWSLAYPLTFCFWMCSFFLCGHYSDVSKVEMKKKLEAKDHVQLTEA